MRKPNKGILATLTALIVTFVALVVPVFAQEPVPPDFPTISPLVVIGIFLGIAARVFYPYWAKLKAAAESPTPVEFKFDIKYVYIAIVNIVQSAVFTTLALQEAPVLPSFLFALTWAYMWQDIGSRQI